ncbi:MAG TPA: ABC transporter substrate-binding protein, partial [Ktedonobacterales bacterium]
MICPRRRPLPLFLSLVILLAGCALPWARNAATRPQPLPDAQQVFHLLMAGANNNGDLDSLDPALIQFGSNYQVAQLIFPPLVTLDDRNQVAPWGADRWETSADGLIWTFHIHPGMRWSDGVPIDASTYAYSLNRSLDPCTASPVTYYLTGTSVELIKGSVAFSNVRYTSSYNPAHACPPGRLVAPDTLIGTSILVPDPLTLTLVLSHPAAYFPAALTYPTAWAQPRQLIERYGATVDPFDTNIFHWTEHLTDGSGF